MDVPTGVDAHVLNLCCMLLGAMGVEMIPRQSSLCAMAPCEADTNASAQWLYRE